MSLILTSFKTSRQHYSIIGVAENRVYIADDIREASYNRMPSLRVIYKGIYEATKWRILCTIPFKSVQNGCVNHGSNLAHYAIVPSQNYILALARGTFDRSSPGQVFIFKIDINNGKYSVYRCSGKSLPPSGIFACAECNDMTVEARNDVQLTITTRGTNRNRNLMEREHEIRLQESRGIFHWFSNTTPPCHSRSPALFALPNIHRQYIQLMIEKEALPCVSFTIQSEWRGPIYKCGGVATACRCVQACRKIFILRANLASSPFWRTLLSRGYFSDGVFIVIIEGALLTVILRMPTLKELAFMALQRASAKPQISTRYYDRLHSPLDYNGISEVALKNILHMNNSLPLIPRIS